MIIFIILYKIIPSPWRDNSLMWTYTSCSSILMVAFWASWIPLMTELGTSAFCYRYFKEKNSFYKVFEIIFWAELSEENGRRGPFIIHFGFCRDIGATLYLPTSRDEQILTMRPPHFFLYDSLDRAIGDWRYIMRPDNAATKLISREAGSRAKNLPCGLHTLPRDRASPFSDHRMLTIFCHVTLRALSHIKYDLRALSFFRCYWRLSSRVYSWRIPRWDHTILKQPPSLPPLFSLYSSFLHLLLTLLRFAYL